MLHRIFAHRLFLVFLAILGWFALLAQFYININSKIAALPELVIRYFSYFTILTNLLVTVCCSILIISPAGLPGKFFQKQQTLTAITIYILVVGVIYNLVLRFIWNPQGLQKIVDELLHSVIPVLFLLYWLVVVKKDTLRYKAVIPWLLYPFIYALVILVRGMFSGFYPYPFIDVSKLGLNKTLLNALILTLFFLVISLSFVWLGKFMSRSVLTHKR